MSDDDTTDDGFDDHVQAYRTALDASSWYGNLLDEWKEAIRS